MLIWRTRPITAKPPTISFAPFVSFIFLFITTVVHPVAALEPGEEDNDTKRCQKNADRGLACCIMRFPVDVI